MTVGMRCEAARRVVEEAQRITAVEQLTKVGWVGVEPWGGRGCKVRRG